MVNRTATLVAFRKVPFLEDDVSAAGLSHATATAFLP